MKRVYFPLLVLLLWSLVSQAESPSGKAPEGTAKKPVFKPLEEDSEPLVSTGAAAEEQKSGTGISGIVRVIRGSPETEVFFKDLKESYVIPVNDSHNEIMEACLKSSRDNQPIHLTVDPISRRILSLSDAGSKSSESPSASGVGNSK